MPEPSGRSAALGHLVEAQRISGTGENETCVTTFIATPESPDRAYRTFHASYTALA